MNTKKGRVTVPTDVDVIEETLNIIERWGADAIRDCDGTSMPEQLRELDVKQYATYYTTRKDNAWASANPQEIQQMYLMSDMVTASAQTLTIPLMKHYYKEQLKVNTLDDIKRWWEVIDRTSGDVVAADKWEYDAEKEAVVVLECAVSCVYSKLSGICDLGSGAYVQCPDQ